MRMMSFSKPSNDKEAKPQGPVRLSSNNVEHCGIPISKYFDEMIRVSETGDMIPIVNAGLISDDIVETQKSWSSEKIQKELRKINDRVSTIIGKGDDVEVGAKEILDARIDSEGLLHTSLGDSIRDQITDVCKKIDAVKAETMNGSNEYYAKETRVSSNAVFVKSFFVSGNDTNEVSLPAYMGYKLVAASNADYDRSRFFVAGVANEKERGVAFLNRVIMNSEEIEIIAEYVRMNS